MRHRKRVFVKVAVVDEADTKAIEQWTQGQGILIRAFFVIVQNHVCFTKPRDKKGSRQASMLWVEEGVDQAVVSRRGNGE